jgi:hypothetical protein
VGLEDVLDPDPGIAGEAQVLVDLEAGVDDGDDSRRAVADEIGGAAEVVMDELAEDHRSKIAGLTSAEAG